MKVEVRMMWGENDVRWEWCEVKMMWGENDVRREWCEVEWCEVRLWGRQVGLYTCRKLIHHVLLMAGHSPWTWYSPVAAGLPLGKGLLVQWSTVLALTHGPAAAHLHDEHHQMLDMLRCPMNGLNKRTDDDGPMVDHAGEKVPPRKGSYLSLVPL
jgi:hypothetical protein